MKLLIISALSFCLFAQDDMNWDMEGDLSQADMEVLDLAADDEQDVADVSDYEYVEDRIEQEQTALAGQEPAQSIEPIEPGQNTLADQENGQNIEPVNQDQIVEDEVQSSQAAIQQPSQLEENRAETENTYQDNNQSYNQEQIQPMEERYQQDSDQPIEGSAPIYNN